VGDPLRQPASMPSGRNLHDFDPSLLPTRAAWELGKTLADQMIRRYRKEKHEYPAKVSMVLWQGETGRSHGTMEAQALFLMGVEPQWNSRGVVDSVKLIPAEKLGRPRVDVVFTISGMYRDGLADKVLLLDRAARLAASAPEDNVLKRHNQEIAARLKSAGVETELAGKVAESRVFGRAPGEYGAGISKMVEQSRNAENGNALAELYLRNMGYIYSQELWGKPVTGALEAHLAGNQAVIHSRSTNVYGVLDNDDFYEFAGGLNLASKSVNGSAPQFYIDNLRAPGRESVEDFQAFLATELHARFWNPKWIKENQKAGYAGARQFARYSEHLYGWQATTPDKVDESVWQQTYDVYVADKNGLELGKFFDEANPHARQRLLARLLEVDRQGIHRFDSEERATLVGEYVTSVNTHGVDCSPNTCGNIKLNQQIAVAAALVPGLGDVELRRFGRVVAKATGWSPRQFQNAPAPLRAGMSDARGLRPRPPSSALRPPSGASRRSLVSGFRMEQKIWHLGQGKPASSPTPLLAAVILMFVLAGMIREARRAA
jgi:cobaltochelatase CobN